MSPGGCGDSLQQMTAKNATGTEENRGKQILTGAAILFTISAMAVGLLMGWRFIPGWVGESFGTLAGVISTPFFMEATFAILGLVIVIGLNTWRRHKAGDEYVAIDISETEDRPGGTDGERR